MQIHVFKTSLSHGAGKRDLGGRVAISSSMVEAKLPHDKCDNRVNSHDFRSFPAPKLQTPAFLFAGEEK